LNAVNTVAPTETNPADGGFAAPTGDLPPVPATGDAPPATPQPAPPNHAAPASLTAPAPPPPAIPQLKTDSVLPEAGPDLSGLNREELEARVKTLMDSLVTANVEAETFRQQWQDLKLRDEALGVEALTVDDQKLEDKLVQAVKELYESEMRRREALQLLDKLLATTQALIQTAPKEDPQTRAEYEAASRAAKDYLAGGNAGGIPIGVTLDDGKIADLNPQLNAVVINLGKSQGVKEGMPFLIYEGDIEVGTAKVVLARELLSAALVESVKPKAVLKVGDRVAVDARP
jgi:hypothetical protein